jgi:3D (Asp-Asp-Asp) domain-containing protein
MAYSNDGISWTTISTSTHIFSVGRKVCWDQKRWIAVGEGPNRIATSYDGITWYGVSTSTTLFTTGGYGLSSNYNASSNQLVVSDTSGTILSNQLDVVSNAYYNQGPTELSLRIANS